MYIQKQKEHRVSSRQTKGTRQNLLDAYLRISVRNNPARSTIRQWYADYENRGIHAHRVRNVWPSIPVSVQNQIISPSNHNPNLSLRVVAT